MNRPESDYWEPAVQAGGCGSPQKGLSHLCPCPWPGAATQAVVQLAGIIIIRIIVAIILNIT